VYPKPKQKRRGVVMMWAYLYTFGFPKGGQSALHGSYESLC